MNECPTLRYDFPTYVLAQRVISVFTTIVNIFTIYCIIFLTPQRAGIYKWHLLWHQIIAAVTDFEMGVVAIPMFILPFTIMVPKGLILQIPFWSTNTMVGVSFLIITGSLSAVVQLFIYRYLRAIGVNRFTWPFIILIGLTYLIFAVPGLGIFYIFDSDQEKVMMELRQTYSCVTTNHTSLPMAIAYSQQKYEYFVSFPIFFINLYMVTVCGLLIYSTFRYLQRGTISPKTAVLERKFLVHLILQVVMPLLIVHGPGYLLMIVQTKHIYGFEVLGVIAMMSMSIYGAMCGLMIIALTPSYRRLFLPKRVTTTSLADNYSSKIGPATKITRSQQI